MHRDASRPSSNAPAGSKLNPSALENIEVFPKQAIFIAGIPILPQQSIDILGVAVLGLPIRPRKEF
jgi:hypothetical protein